MPITGFRSARPSSRRALPALAASLALALAAAACAPHRTGPTEVGVVFNKLTRSLEIKPAGATYFFLPFVNDWRTFDISQRSLVMNSDAGSGDRRERDDLRFKTRDGNDIDTDVTVRWRIDPSRVGAIWQQVAASSDEVEHRLVRPLTRTYVRDVLNRLDSEEFYNPRLRFAAANDATRLLAERLQPYGVIVEVVLLGDFSFKHEYQRLINLRKEAEKQAEKLEAEIHATQEANQANLQARVAQLTQELTAAQGGFEQAKREADAYVIKRQQEAQATLAERSATATGIQRERAALNSSAGDAYVNLQLIEALQKKEIRQIPKLPGGNIIIDGNELLRQLGVLRYQQGRDSRDADSGTAAPNPPSGTSPPNDH
ncbi:MAG TPA: SPFH domain-containing protein [Thermoanaerobaculia bacterium]|nr:SPFH domain-containing protein [Thermoanaerobaculia bacterium]